MTMTMPPEDSYQPSWGFGLLKPLFAQNIVNSTISNTTTTPVTITITTIITTISITVYITSILPLLPQLLL